MIQLLGKLINNPECSW